MLSHAVNPKAYLIAAAIVTHALSASAQDAGKSCGNPFVNHFGPWDYRSATQQHLKVVEDVHFTPGIETLTKPSTTLIGLMAADVGYTLHVFPNHHRALITLARLGEKHKTNMPPGAKYTIECYFERAIQFRPDDNVARLLYVQYLAKTERKELALAQLREAQRRARDNPLSTYNVGLVAFDLGAFDLALIQMHAAAAAGFPRRELEEKLRKAGHWADRAPAPSAAASEN